MKEEKIMTIPAFDTLSAAEELQRDYGFEQRQAEGIAKLVHHQLIGNVATKDDIAALKEDIEGVKKDVQSVREELRAVDARLDGKIDALENRMGQTFATKAELYKLIGGQTVVIVGVLIAFRFFA